MIKKYSHTMFYSLDLDKAVTWYCEKLGFEIDYHAPSAYASLRHRDLGRIALHATDDKRDIGFGPLPYFLCEDIKKTCEELKKRGVWVGEPRREGDSPFFCDMKDFDGNLIGLEEM